ncbi:hypothetical protein HK104_005201, partial [Borealophlyctis nickersoniae]
MTPSLFLRFSPEHRSQFLKGSTSVTNIILGGEAFPSAIIGEVDSSRVLLWNIYGTTECSVWATLKEVKTVDDAECIGEPLDGTEIEVREFDEGGGVGELWIGGVERVCFVGDDREEQRLRPTGDVVRVDTATKAIKFVGRRDNQIKRTGYRVHPEAVAGAFEKIPEVGRCEVVYIPPTPTDSNSTRGMGTGRLIAYVCMVNPVLDTDATVAQLQTSIQDLLPFYAQPDEIRILDRMPVTHHGKVDRQALLSLPHVNPATIPTPETNQDVKRRVLEILTNHLPVPTDRPLEDGKWWFLAEGGTSLDAVRAVEAMLEWMGLADLESEELDRQRLVLMNLILHHPAEDIANHVSTISRHRDTSTVDHDTHTTKRKATDEDVDTDDTVKRLRSDHASVVVLRRADGAGVEAAASLIRRFEAQFEETECGEPETGMRCRMAVEWQIDMEKCIDASPTVCLREMNG